MGLSITRNLKECVLRQVLMLFIASLYLNSYGIYNGKDADIRELPWQVSIQDESYFHFCGGAIIGPKHILTAAHCVEAIQPWNVEKTQIFAGAASLNDVELLPGVSKIFIHSEYVRSDENDIALIELEEEIEFSDSIQPIELDRGSVLGQNHSDQNGLNVLISGWGDGNHRHQERLQWGFVSVENCFGILCEFYLPESEVFLKGSSTYCGSGDSGGAAVTYDNIAGFYKLIGVTNYGESKRKNSVCVYAKVSAHIGWIDLVQQGKFKDLPLIIITNKSTLVDSY